MVSPVQKNGGQVDPPGAIAKGGVLRAAADGQSVTYGSSASFGAGAQGAPPASQYLATRNAGGWSTQNITAPIFSGSYDVDDQGVPYQLFSTDLARGILLNGQHCRGESGECAVANPPLVGTGAPAGFQNYYLRESSSAAFTALLGTTELLETELDPAHFDVTFAGGSPDLRHIVLSTCAALTPGATEVPLGEGCDPGKPNLYRWSSPGGLSLINPPSPEPSAALAAQSGAISVDGSRVYWIDQASGDLYLREGALTKLVDGGGGAFEIATPDGAKALFTKEEHIYRYDAATQISTDLTPSGEVVGVLGASADLTHVYYLDTGGLQHYFNGITVTVAPGADAALPGNFPPTTGTARVSADGKYLLFLSKASLTGYDNTDLNTGQPDAQAFLYDANTDSLTCVSCNPTNERLIGEASLPGAIPNGTAPGSTNSYKPRTLSSDGRRVFFETSDALVSTDTNTTAPDVYQWEAEGKGSCAKAGGCVSLISSGRSPDGATFIDASTDGADVFFTTDDSLVAKDPGAIDLYDARVGGGFDEPTPPIPCEGDACQFLPSDPVDPTLTTLLSGPGNPKVHFAKRCKPGFVKRKGKCVKRGSRPKGNRRGNRRGGKR